MEGRLVKEGVEEGGGLEAADEAADDEVRRRKSDAATRLTGYARTEDEEGEAPLG